VLLGPHKFDGSVPFSALEAEDRPTVEPSSFDADGRWSSAPARLDGDSETGLSRELRERRCPYCTAREPASVPRSLPW
jgi:hypothetical protein